MRGKRTLGLIYGAVAALLLLCLFDMPYGFYVLVRFIATAAFCFFAFEEYQQGNTDRMILFIILAVLFQPLWKIPLGRVIWDIVDVVVAGYLVYLLHNVIKKKY